ncbi:hypothetical protein [Streptomyces sp. HUAS TT20]|uniref:hypothetical protein n=1 Tax=Streptomyces sp. HUAS TT20 TaxID=3447509 RepID=UPI0021DB3CD5|nr:hypothetical protein [Streptomyces sp. HUAS 15-9]UXY33240.1 hypothetical protein N8I87_43840 [Streptomyces sp. HUAS 15-9]
MQGDRRQIQTAVLGGADSEDPLMLPLEAIELDAFRRHHEHDTFWCGLLLGGCGLQLTTKLYTDRVCHFAHYPGPDGHPHVCGRRARGVNSADHLYVKSEAAAWLRNRGLQADFEFTQPEGAPVGSVVDIQFQHGGLRVHLDQAVQPAWDQDGLEPVLGMSVPVERDTLIDRWYVHRIRLNSEGTSRKVQIGTEAFAREPEWFALDDCEMTERGLSTPAVERIVRARSTRPPSRWPTGKVKKVPGTEARAQVVLRRLADALKVESVVVVNRVLGEIAAVTGVSQQTQAELDTAVAGANRWLEGQAEVRRDLFARLDEAVAARRTKQIRELLARVNATASHDRTDTEDVIAAAAADYMTAFTSEAYERVRGILDGLSRTGRHLQPAQMRPLVEKAIQAAADAGSLTGDREAIQIAYWKERAGLNQPTSPSPARPARAAPAGDQQQPRRRNLHKQVARRYWIKRSCPRCHAGQGHNCVIDNQTSTGEVRNVPHDERLQPILEERKAKQQQQTPPPSPWRVYDVTCPDCSQGPDARCESPGGPHRSRVELAKEYSRLRKPPPKR